MDFKFAKEFMESVFHEEMWIFEIIFCMLAPAFLFAFLLSKEIFFSIELIKLLLLCILSNSVLFYIFFIYQFSYKKRIIDDINYKNKELIDIEKEGYRNEREFTQLEHEINIMINSNKKVCKKLIKNKEKVSILSKKMEITRNRQKRMKHELENDRKQCMIEIIKNIFNRIVYICVVILILITQKYIYNINLGKEIYTLFILLSILLLILRDSLKNIKDNTNI